MDKSHDWESIASDDYPPCEVYQYSGPRYPDDSDGLGAVVIKRGSSIWSDHGWISDGQPYHGPKYPDD